MKCRKVRTLLPDYIGDELSANHQRHLDQHLKGCPGCRDDLRRLQAVWDGLAHQPLPQKEEGFWQAFTRGVMAETRKQSHVPSKEKHVFIFPSWRFLVPAASMAVVILVSVIVLRGGLWGPLGTGVKNTWIPPLDEQETIADTADTLSFAPVVTDEKGLWSKEAGLQELTSSAGVSVISLKSADMATITEVLTQRFGEEDIYEKLEGLTGKELEEFYQLLSSKYPYS